MAVITIILLAWNVGWAAPSSDLWAKWQGYDSGNSQTIDHGEWDNFLKKYLDTEHFSGVYRMDYKAVSITDKRFLFNYLEQLQALPILEYNRQEQKAYWINLYNALTVKVILDHYPVESIKDIDISPGFFNFGPWDAKLLRIEGEELSLNDVEHRILRPIWNDNRIHYAVNCASIGCPNLAGKAYTSSNIEELLDNAAKDYINHPRGVTFVNGELVVSKIYDWYEEDFGGNESGVINHLIKYAGDNLVKKLKSYNDGFDTNYDWSLNEP